MENLSASDIIAILTCLGVIVVNVITALKADKAVKIAEDNKKELVKNTKTTDEINDKTDELTQKTKDLTDKADAIGVHTNSTLSEVRAECEQVRKDNDYLKRLVESLIKIAPAEAAERIKEDLDRRKVTGDFRTDIGDRLDEIKSGKKKAK